MVDRRIHLLVPHGCGLLVPRDAIPAVTVHRCRRIDAIDLGPRRSDGVRLTKVARTLFDSSAIVSAQSVESAIEQALREQRCTIDDLFEVDGRLFHPRRPGAIRFRQVLGSRPVKRGTARSDLEIRVRRAIADRGLPEPEVNSLVEVMPGEEYEVDLCWRPWKLAAEVDHPFWHDGSEEVLRDRRRDRRLASAGWLTTRIDEREIEEDLDGAIDDIALALQARGWKPSLVV